MPPPNDPSFQLQKIDIITSTKARVTFTKPVQGSAAALTAANWTVAGLTVASLAALDAGGVAFSPYGNLGLWSGDYTQAAWTNAALAVTPNAVTDPLGFPVASLVPSTSNTTHTLTQGYTMLASTDYTLSVVAKANGYKCLGLRVIPLGGGVSSLEVFDLVAGTKVGSGNTGATMTSLGNGWYQCQVTVNGGTGATAPTFQIYTNGNTVTASSPLSFAGDGTSGIYVSEVMWEQRSTSTSFNAYLKTTDHARYQSASYLQLTVSGGSFSGTTPELVTLAAGVVNDATDTYSIGSAGNTTYIGAPGSGSLLTAQSNTKTGRALPAVLPVLHGMVGAGSSAGTGNKGSNKGGNFNTGFN